MYTPFELVYGRPANQIVHQSTNVDPITQPVNPNEYINEVKWNLALAFQRAREYIVNNEHIYKKYYDRFTNSIDVKIGDKVLLANQVRNKFDPFYSIGYEVIKLDSNSNVTLRNINTGRLVVVHKNRIRH